MNKVNSTGLNLINRITEDKNSEKISPTTTIGSKTALKRLKSFPESLKT